MLMMDELKVNLYWPIIVGIVCSSFYISLYSITSGPADIIEYSNDWEFRMYCSGSLENFLWKMKMLIAVDVLWILEYDEKCI